MSATFAKQYNTLANAALPVLNAQSSAEANSLSWINATRNLLEIEKQRVVLFRQSTSRTVYADNNGMFAFYDLMPSNYLVYVEGTVKDRIIIWNSLQSLKEGGEVLVDYGEQNVGGTEKVYAFADKSINSGRQQQAIQPLESAADQNNKGMQYLNGDGVKKDLREAAKWFLSAAKNGSPNAQCTLGAMYHQGLGVEQDEAKALEYTRQSAEQGFAAGEMNLGLAYYNGWGVQKDDAKAVQWFTRAAEHGDKDAEANLNAIVQNDSQQRGSAKSPPDRDAAEKWLTRAADVIVQLKINNGDLISARRYGFVMEYVKNSADCDAKANVGYTFTFKTKSGLTRQHDGYLYFYHDPRRKDWFNSEINIDGSPMYGR
jgi:hypothetical protein